MASILTQAFDLKKNEHFYFTAISRDYWNFTAIAALAESVSRVERETVRLLHQKRPLEPNLSRSCTGQLTSLMKESQQKDLQESTVSVFVTTVYCIR